MNDKDSVHDIIIVGAGPCGLAAGIEAQQAGLSAVLFDRGPVVSSLIDYPLDMTFFSTPENLEIGGLPFVCRGDKPTREEALKYYRRAAVHYGLDVHQYEEVTGVERTEVGFRVATRSRWDDTAVYRARHLVVAIGTFDLPNALDVPGEDLSKVRHRYQEPHPYFDQDCLVVGGGNSAAEAALALFRAGARVTLVHFLEELDPGLKPWVRPDIENRIREGSIAAHFRTRVVRIDPRTVTLRDERTGDLEELKNDWVLAMTGYRPDVGFLRGLGIELDPETGVPSHDADTMESNVPGIYIAGVLAAGYDPNRIFIENGRHHGGRIVRAITGR